MMIKIKNLVFLLTVIYCANNTLTAQALVEKNIEVGMTVKIMPCKKDNKAVESMDLYRKTLNIDKIKVDTATGDSLFETFFDVGDFDMKRLPCEYANKKYKIAALRVFDDEENKTEKRVMLLYTKDPLTYIWVEFDKAIELKEIEF